MKQFHGIHKEHCCILQTELLYNEQPDTWTWSTLKHNVIDGDITPHRGPSGGLKHNLEREGGKEGGREEGREGEKGERGRAKSHSEVQKDRKSYKDSMNV